jgi:tetratricopeptide (TPR) repeat protein
VERAETGKVSDTNLVVAFGNLAEALRWARQFDEAEKLFDRALGILRTGAGMNGRQAAVLLNNRGRLYLETRRYALAQSDLKQGLRLTERAFGARHAQMVQVLNSLGALSLAMHQRKDAERSFKKAIALADRLGLEDAVAAIALGNLATLYEQQRDWRRARDLHVRALRIMEASRGPNHPQTAAILANLGIAYFWQGKLDEAERVLRRSIGIPRNAPSPDGTVATAYFGLGLVLTARGRYDEARSNYSAALETQEKILGPKAPEIARTLDEFASLLRKMNLNTEALSMQTRADSIRAFWTYTAPVSRKSRR